MGLSAEVNKHSQWRSRSHLHFMSNKNLHLLYERWHHLSSVIMYWCSEQVPIPSRWTCPLYAGDDLCICFFNICYMFSLLSWFRMGRHERMAGTSIMICLLLYYYYYYCISHLFFSNYPHRDQFSGKKNSTSSLSSANQSKRENV